MPSIREEIEDARRQGYVLGLRFMMQQSEEVPLALQLAISKEITRISRGGEIGKEPDAR